VAVQYSVTTPAAKLTFVAVQNPSIRPTLSLASSQPTYEGHQ
jgi:hypothetical protein